LPPIVSRYYLEELVDELQSESEGTALRLLDFSHVKHIDAAGHGEFFRLTEILHDPQASTSLLGMPKSVRRHLAASRVFDVVGHSHSQMGNTLTALSSSPDASSVQEIGCQSYVMAETTLIFLSGRVSGDGLAGLGFLECLEHSARDRTCIIDMRNVTLLESTAIAKLQPVIDDMHQRSSGAIMVSGAGTNVQQMFRMTGLSESVISIDDKTLLAAIAPEGLGHES
jgi:anti-anti-sigma regulatory factor